MRIRYNNMGSTRKGPFSVPPPPPKKTSVKSRIREVSVIFLDISGLLFYLDLCMILFSLILIKAQ